MLKKLQPRLRGQSLALRIACAGGMVGRSLPVSREALKFVLGDIGGFEIVSIGVDRYFCRNLWCSSSP